jgi:hypothetical protein
MVCIRAPLFSAHFLRSFLQCVVLLGQRADNAGVLLASVGPVALVWDSCPNAAGSFFVGFISAGLSRLLARRQAILE